MCTFVPVELNLGILFCPYIRGSVTPPASNPAGISLGNEGSFKDKFAALSFFQATLPAHPSTCLIPPGLRGRWGNASDELHPKSRFDLQNMPDALQGKSSVFCKKKIKKKICF